MLGLMHELEANLKHWYKLKCYVMFLLRKILVMDSRNVGLRNSYICVLTDMPLTFPNSYSMNAYPLTWIVMKSGSIIEVTIA